MSDSGRGSAHDGKTPSGWRVTESPAGDNRGECEAGMPADAATELGFDVDSPPSKSRAAGKSDPPDPRQKALELLSRREHSRQELIQKLVTRGFDAEAAENAVHYMTERGWQDDGRYAEARARSRMLGGHGPLRIRAELRQHGVAEAEVELALDACEVDWQALAAEELQRRFGTDKADTRKEIARRGAFLQRRGFDLDAIRYALAADFD